MESPTCSPWASAEAARKTIPAWTRGLCLLFSLSLGYAQPTGEVRGTVVDARDGEPLARVQVQLLGTGHQVVTDSAGRFVFPVVQPGEHVLHVSTVGYRLLKRSFVLATGEIREFEVVLAPEALRQTDSVQVSAGPFDAARHDSPSQLVLAGDEAKNLASVLADDPLRAVQSLPGVTANNDFDSRFSLRGASYQHLGLYWDDILLHTPFHTVQGEPVTGGLTIFSGDALEGITLHAGAPSARFGDRTAGVLEVYSRAGSRVRTALRATASASNASLLAEGPIGRNRRGDWIASVRKSYLHYIIERVADEPTLAFGFFDSQGKVTYDLGPKHTLSLSVVDGFSGLDRTRVRPWLGVNDLMTSAYHFSLANFAWRYAPGERFLFTNRLAVLRERFDNRNPREMDLVGGHYGEYVWNASGTWLWPSRNTVDFGCSLRALRDRGYTNYYQFTPFAVRRVDEFEGSTFRAGGFVQSSWRLAAGRLRLTGGVRFDGQEATRVRAVAPQASLAVSPTRSTRLELGWGQYVQYPELRWLFSSFGSTTLLPERATHFLLGVEQALDERTRLRMELYHRWDRDVLFRPFYEPRLIDGEIFHPPPDAPLRNSTRGYARGFEIFFQRRSANKVTGWVSYAWGNARAHDREANIDFPADYDQRHTVNVYLSYRLRPSVNLSVKWLYGSGFPIPGFFRRAGGLYFLAETRNAVRLDPYQRADLRMNKAFAHHRWKLTLYGELVNLFNRRNLRFSSFNGYDPMTGRARISFDRMFPILPSVGVALDF